jgi:alpha-D-ribose 1-methylphosphonate 5-triphosphate synthase subunit PhnH
MVNGTTDWHEAAYTQRMFRILLSSMSRPGRIQSTEHLPHPAAATSTGYHPSFLGIGLTVLDQEVSYSLSSSFGDLASLIRGMTMARQIHEEETDYMFIRGEEAFDLTRLRKGSFHYPDQSATVICQVNVLTNEPMAGGLQLLLRGSGIKETQTLVLDTLHPMVLDSWLETNKEFPLGIDWIFVDQNGRVCAVPRSTEIIREVG